MRTTNIITDPIYQVMSFGSDPSFIECLKRVMDTKTFQRLRRITQLGLASYVFPGATHTRFSHSLGVANLARTVLLHLKESKSEAEITEMEFNSVMFAALLHDVGHGPFSHSFERVLKHHKNAPNHEDWTTLLISHDDSEIRRCLREHGMDVARICSVFNDSSDDELARPLKQIVSSQLDVDRMDYLVRDAHFAGIAVGRFDVDYLIQSLTVIEHGAAGPVTLGITRKGVKAYEGFLIARQLMNRTLYYHHIVQILEFMMERFLRLVVEHVGDIKGAALELVPPYFKRVAEARSQGLEKSAFMRAAYDDYIHLTEDQVWTMIGAAAENRLTTPLAKPADQLLTREILPHFIVRAGKTMLLREALLNGGFREPQDFHLLVSETTMYKGGGDQRVFVQDEENNIEEIPRHSETISVFRDRPEAESFLIVLDPERTEKIRSVAENGQFLLLRNERHEGNLNGELVSDGIPRIPPRREEIPNKIVPVESGTDQQ